MGLGKLTTMCIKFERGKLYKLITENRLLKW